MAELQPLLDEPPRRKRKDEDNEGIRHFNAGGTRRFDVLLVGGTAVAATVALIAAIASRKKGGKAKPGSSKPPVINGALFDLPAGLKARAKSSLPGDVPAPILVVLHGREGNEQQLVPLVPDDLFAHVYYLRGGVQAAAKDRWSFFNAKYSEGPAVLAPAIEAAVVDVRAAIQALKDVTLSNDKVYVLGGSQGGHIAHALARAGDVDGAVVVSGALPPTLYPAVPNSASVIGIHGTKDTVVPTAAGKATIDAFRAAGYPRADWVPLAGGGHALGALAVSPAHAALRSLMEAP